MGRFKQFREITKISKLVSRMSLGETLSDKEKDQVFDFFKKHGYAKDNVEKNADDLMKSLNLGNIKKKSR